MLNPENPSGVPQTVAGRVRAMRGMTDTLSIGERIAWYRRRRGLSQEVLAGLVAHTPDWLSKVENGRIQLDRLSVIKALADALDVAIGDLLAEPSLLEWTPQSGRRTITQFGKRSWTTARSARFFEPQQRRPGRGSKTWRRLLRGLGTPINSLGTPNARLGYRRSWPTRKLLPGVVTATPLGATLSSPSAIRLSPCSWARSEKPIWPG
jgi:transcriptional regulator with XRE-family HTH domain